MLLATVYNRKYWTCICRGLIEKYLHSKRDNLCTVCGSLRDDRPHATQVEVDAFKFLTQKLACKNG